VRTALGIALGIGGIGIAVVGFRNLMLAANPLSDESTPLILVGLCVLFMGVTIGLPNVVGFPQRVFLALTVTCMALAFDWIAFIPGPREFYAGSSAAHPGGAVNSTFGRVVFGLAAVLMDLFAFYAWRLSIRILMTGSETKKPPEGGSN
jgi:hypothetical protein